MKSLERGAIGLAIIALLVGYALHEARQTGRAEGRAEVAAREVLVKSRAVAKADTIYRDSLKVLTRWKTRWDSIRVTDTIVITRDTGRVVYVPRAAADSALNVCYAVVRSCDRAGVAKDSLIASLRAGIPPDPSAWDTFRERAALVGFGVALAEVVRVVIELLTAR